MCIYVHTVFTWLNTAATISHALKLDVATIWGWLLFEGGYYLRVATIQGNVHYINVWLATI